MTPLSPAFSMEGPAPGQLSSTDSAHRSDESGNRLCSFTSKREATQKICLTPAHFTRLFTGRDLCSQEPSIAQSAPVPKKREGPGSCTPKLQKQNYTRSHVGKCVAIAHWLSPMSILLSPLAASGLLHGSLAEHWPHR